ncbi:MAG TPA: MCE family protein, partial [Acidimicrobiales bacterium]|nr:MCE family protein [Acidimicrobiales bacterium]
ADFSQGIGLYPGSPVRVLGINIGRITDITNRGNLVRVDMHIDKATTRLPADVTAAIVPVSLLGERYIQFSPVYTGGAALTPGAHLQVTRTQVPVEIDELLRGLKDFFGAIKPENAHDLVANLATVINGEGTQLNQLIANAAGTLRILADKGNDLGQLVDSLAKLTTTLQSHTNAIVQLVRNYDTVSGVLAQNKGALDDTVTQLTRTATELADLITRHQDPLKQDVGVLTTAGRTLDRNIDSLDKTLSSTVRLFEAAGRAYDPQRNMLPLSTQGAPDVLGEAAASRLRDRLAGVCRRLAATIGASPTLAQCSDPNSNFFTPILGLLPGILSPNSATASAAGDTLTNQVLAKLPPLTPAQQARLAEAEARAATTTTTVPTPASKLQPLLPPPPKRVTATKSSGGLFGRLLHGLADVFR